MGNVRDALKIGLAAAQVATAMPSAAPAAEHSRPRNQWTQTQPAASQRTLPKFEGNIKGFTDAIRHFKAIAAEQGIIDLSEAATEQDKSLRLHKMINLMHKGLQEKGIDLTNQDTAKLNEAAVTMLTTGPTYLRITDKLDNLAIPARFVWVPGTSEAELSAMTNPAIARRVLRVYLHEAMGHGMADREVLNPMGYAQAHSETTADIIPQILIRDTFPPSTAEELVKDNNRFRTLDITNAYRYTLTTPDSQEKLGDFVKGYPKLPDLSDASLARLAQHTLVMVASLPIPENINIDSDVLKRQAIAQKMMLKISELMNQHNHEALKNNEAIANFSMMYETARNHLLDETTSPDERVIIQKVSTELRPWLQEFFAAQGVEIRTPVPDHSPDR